MRVRVQPAPKHPEGFAFWFPYSETDKDHFKQCLGAQWDQKLRTWYSEGPEILLDMQRFNVEISDITPEARVIAEAFRQQLWEVMDARLEDVSDEMFGYQRQGSKILSLSPRMILGDEMGTGKTKQALDACKLINAKSILVLAPKTITYNWIAEIDKWQPDYTAAIVPDKPEDRKAFWTQVEKPNIIIANYEKLLREDFPKDVDFDVVIADEAQRLKNSTTQTYKQAKKLIRRAFFTWCLTGTPLEIRLPELYNIMALLRPAVFGNYVRFRDQHLITDWMGTVVGAKNLELLRDRIGPFLLRRTKREVLKQLPEKMPPINNYVKFSPAEQKAYQAMTSAFNNWLTERGVSGAGDPLVQMLRMRQFCATPALFTDELGHGSKFESLLELLEDWPGKAVVFCFFEEATDLMHGWLRKLMPNDFHEEAYISGPIKAELRKPRVDAFNEGKRGRIFLSTDAGQMGLNITGADLIVHYDQLWNPQKMHQREDRLHRIGQENVVNVVNMLCMDSIDVGMYELNLEREQLFDEVIEGAEEAMLRKLNAPRLRAIVEGRLNRATVRAQD